MRASYIVVNAGRRSYDVAQCLEQNGMLAKAVIDGCGTVGLPRLLGMVPRRWLPAGVNRLIARRPAVTRSKLMSSTALGVWYARALARAADYTDAVLVQIEFMRRMDALALSTDWTGATAVYVHDGATDALLDRVRAGGLRLVHEQTIAAGEVMQKLLEQESERYPGWEKVAALPADVKETCRQAYFQSWAAADLIICGSEFVRASIRESCGPVERCEVLPYGVRVSAQPPVRTAHGGPLRVLTVGTVGLRKGAADTLAAARTLGPAVHFRMVGRATVSATAARDLAAHVELTGPLPAAAVADQFRWANVYLLPSICEGSAVSVYEAMAAGLPVVTTLNAGSIVRDGLDGFIIPIRRPDLIVEKLTTLAADPGLRSALGANGRAAVAACTTEAYGRRLAALLGPAGPVWAGPPVAGGRHIQPTGVR